MQKTTFKTYLNASLSLASILQKGSKKLEATAAVRAAGLDCKAGEPVEKQSKVSVNIICDQQAFEKQLAAENLSDQFENLADGLYSAHLTLASAAKIVKLDSVKRIQTKKVSALHLGNGTTETGLRSQPGATRVVSETGKGVLIGIVDSGFDLTHPMFRDSSGNLRVEALLDQTTGKTYSANQLSNDWSGVANPDGPGGDDNGHGTHVASIAGGTEHHGFEGVAPEARFLLVKTNFQDTDEAVKWCFTKANANPCVVNLSLGHHWGGHDGSTAEEVLYKTLVDPGKIIVTSAGNERTERIHIGGRFVPSQTESVGFRVSRRPPNGASQLPDPPFAALTLWYERDDEFTFTLVTPTGQRLPIPSVGTRGERYGDSQVDLELGHLYHAGPTPGKYVQILLSFKSPSVRENLLDRWTVQVKCISAEIGRLDGWFNNSGFATFYPSRLLELTRTIGLPATSEGCIAVASHVSNHEWESDDGPQKDETVLRGRTSPFSSQGPTRDGRQKPEISGPGQYLTAALAQGSSLAGVDERTLKAKQLLSIQGTSMSAPMVAGAIALMLQKKRSLTPAQAIEAMRKSAMTDGHTASVWNPAYGHGKLNIAGAISEL